MQRAPASAQVALLAFGALTIAGATVAHPEGNAMLALFAVNSVVVALAVSAGLWWHVGWERSRGSGWRCFAAGVVAYAMGDVIWAASGIEATLGAVGTIADGLYLLSYVLFAVAMLRLADERGASLESWPQQLVDASILFAAAFATLWVFDLAGDSVEAGLSIPETFAAMMFPAADLFLLGLVVRLAVGDDRWPRALWLSSVAFGGLFVADLAWRNLVADGKWTATSPVMRIFMGSFVVLGAAILDRSAREVHAPRPHAHHPVPMWGVLGILALISLVPAVVVVFADTRLNSQADRLVFGAAVALLPLLIVVRLGGLLTSYSRTTANLDLVIDSSPVAMAVVRPGGSFEIWNRAAARISGYSVGEMLDGGSTTVRKADVASIAPVLQKAFAGLRQEDVAVTLSHRDGHAVDVRVSAAPMNGGDGRVIAMFEDVTQERRHLEQLEFIARHDSLTGLPNRLLFSERLTAALHDGTSDDIDVVLLDVDNFKSLNDTAGLATGDDMLRELGDVLGSAVGDDHFLARLSGDEFALLLRSSVEADGAEIAERALAAARRYRRPSSDGDLDVTFSAGLYTAARTDTADLALRCADEALFHAKSKGKNRLERWSPDGSPTIHAARTWSPLIKDALTADRVQLYLQPIVRLADHGVAFYEALARLVTEEGEVLPAGAWIEHAEELGLMPAVDGRMLQLARQFLLGSPGSSVLVNISPSSLHDDGLIAQLDDCLLGLPPGSLGIEITEHAALRDPEETGELIKRLQANGARVAIDDFGVGFTSFRDLGTIPCNVVKIPSHVAADAADTAVVARAIAAVAHHYGRAVVIEGIETAEAAVEARAMGIEYGQGWYFGRPRSASGPRAVPAAPAA